MKQRIVLLPVLLAFLVGAEPALAWTWPADGPVRQLFTYVGDPYGGGQHRGIDIDATPGSSVVAPTAGIVTFAGSVPGSGRTVTIRTPDGYAVTLLHLGALLVARGVEVDEGEAVGRAPSAGETRPPEVGVHLGVRRAAEPSGYVDPLGLLPSGDAVASELAASPSRSSAPASQAPAGEGAPEPLHSSDSTRPEEAEIPTVAQAPVAATQADTSASTLEPVKQPAPAPPSPPLAPAASTTPVTAASSSAVGQTGHSRPADARAQKLQPAGPQRDWRSTETPVSEHGSRAKATRRGDRRNGARIARTSPRPGAPEVLGTEGGVLAPARRAIETGEAGRSSVHTDARPNDVTSPKPWIRVVGEVFVLLGLVGGFGGLVVAIVHRRARRPDAGTFPPMSAVLRGEPSDDLREQFALALRSRSRTAPTVDSAVLRFGGRSAAIRPSERPRHAHRERGGARGWRPGRRSAAGPSGLREHERASV